MTHLRYIERDGTGAGGEPAARSVKTHPYPSAVVAAPWNAASRIHRAPSAAHTTREYALGGWK